MANSYSALPIELVIRLIGNLEAYKNGIYFEHDKKTDHLYSVFKVDTLMYLIFENKKDSDEIKIYQTSAAPHFVLQSTFVLYNVEEISLSLINSEAQVTINSTNYPLLIYINNKYSNTLTQLKSNILHIFANPSKTFLVYDTFILNFTKLREFYHLSYIGCLTENGILSLTTYDDSLKGFGAFYLSKLFLFANTENVYSTNEKFTESVNVVHQAVVPFSSYLYSVDTLESYTANVHRSSYKDGLLANTIRGFRFVFLNLLEKIQINETTFLTGITDINTKPIFGLLLRFNINRVSDPIYTESIPLVLHEEDGIELSDKELKFPLKLINTEFIDPFVHDIYLLKDLYLVSSSTSYGPSNKKGALPSGDVGAVTPAYPGVTVDGALGVALGKPNGMEGRLAWTDTLNSDYGGPSFGGGALDQQARAGKRAPAEAGQFDAYSNWGVTQGQAEDAPRRLGSDGQAVPSSKVKADLKAGPGTVSMIDAMNGTLATHAGSVVNLT